VIDVGDALPGLTYTVTNTAGVAAAAASVALTIALPDGSTTAPSTATAATGVYTATYVTTLAGRHVARWVALTITGGASRQEYEQTFDVSSTSRSIVGLAEAKAFLRITGSDDDEQLRDVLEAASDMCERYTRKVWRRTTVTAEIHSGGVDVIYLRQAPVVSVTTVVDTGVTLAATSYTIDLPTGRLFYGDTTFQGWWTPGQDNISVTYVTGPPSGIVPAYIRGGMLELVEHLWSSRRGGSNLPRKAAGGEEFSNRLAHALPWRVQEMWGSPAPLVR
jgi:hypothetical protein